MKSKGFDMFRAAPGIFWLLFLASLAFGAAVATASGKVSEYPNGFQRNIQYSYTLQNRSPKLIQNIEFLTYAPTLHNRVQSYNTDIVTSHPHELIVDRFGNQILRFRFNHLPPNAARVLQIRAHLKIDDVTDKVELRDKDLFLQAEPYIETDDPRIKDLTAKLQTTDPSRTAVRIFQWVRANIEYAGYIAPDRSAVWALKNRIGDCTEYMYLFVALARACGIPARGIGGYVAGNNAVLKPAGYHNWAEFYADGAWKIADPQKGKFMVDRADYIAMRVIGQGTPAKFHRFWCSSNAVEIRMNGGQ